MRNALCSTRQVLAIMAVIAGITLANNAVAKPPGPNQGGGWEAFEEYLDQMKEDERQKRQGLTPQCESEVTQAINDNLAGKRHLGYCVHAEQSPSIYSTSCVVEAPLACGAAVQFLCDYYTPGPFVLAVSDFDVVPGPGATTTFRLTGLNVRNATKLVCYVGRDSGPIPVEKRLPRVDWGRLFKFLTPPRSPQEQRQLNFEEF